jgi:hypothetical protein
MVGNGDFEEFIGLRYTTLQYTRIGNALKNWVVFLYVHSDSICKNGKISA